MDAGLPVVVTEVGGLGEASSEYDGAILVPAGRPASLADGLWKALKLRGRSFEDTGSWASNANAVLELLGTIEADPQTDARS